MHSRPIDLQETHHFLSHYFKISVTQVEAFGTGAWSQAFSFVKDQQKYVLRWSHTRENFERDQLAATYQRDGLPIPHILEIGHHHGSYFAISEFIEGVYFEHTPVTELAKLVPAIIKLFSALQSVDLSKTSGFGNWDAQGRGRYSSWSAFLLDVKNDRPEKLIHGWSKKLAASEVGFERFDHLYNQLEKLVAFCPEKRGLVHSDLINYNVLAKDDSISAVLDWGSSLYGDPLYDLAWLRYYEPWYPHFTQVRLNEELLTAFKVVNDDHQDLDERLRCYYLHIGLDSIAYNAFKEDWQQLRETLAYTEQFVN
jgi:hygromycin-B 4-O-kinase